MRKSFSIYILFILLAVLLTGCKPSMEISEEELSRIVKQEEYNWYSEDLKISDDSSNHFLITSSYVYHYVQEDEKIKVILETYAGEYFLEGTVLKLEEAAIIPAALTFTKKADEYVLENRQMAEDGTKYTSSVQDFCVTPVTHQILPNVAEQILSGGTRNELKKMHDENLVEYLKNNKLINIEYDDDGDDVPDILNPK